MKNSKVFIGKDINTGKLTNLRKITFVCRQKQLYDKNSIAIWWSKNYGLGVVDKPNRQLKYVMIGVSLIGIKCWLHFTWIGYCKNEPLLKLKDN